MQSWVEENCTEKMRGTSVSHASTSDMEQICRASGDRDGDRDWDREGGKKMGSWVSTSPFLEWLCRAGKARSDPKLQAANWSKPLKSQMLTQSIFQWGRAQRVGPKGQIALAGISVVWHGASQKARDQSTHKAQRSLSAKPRHQLNEETTE